MSLKRVQAIVRGRVQGVFYRASTEREARRLGLRGWVKNRADGSVEFVAEGAAEQLDELLAWAHKGPPAARVDGVDVSWCSYSGEFPDFRVIE